MKKKLLNLMKLRTAMMLAAVVVTFLGLPTKAWADEWVRSGDTWDASSYTLTVNSDPPAGAYIHQDIVYLIIGNNVKNIGDGAFSSCMWLKSLEIEGDLKSIGDDAFACTSLENVFIPASVNHIGNGAFRDCNSIRSFSVASENTTYKSDNDVLMSKDGKTLIAYPAYKDATSYTIPSDVETICNDAFESCSRLTSITVSSSTPSALGNSVFSGKISEILVNYSSLAAYRQADGWSKYATKIKAIETTIPTTSGTCGKTSGDDVTWTMTDADNDGIYETLTIGGTGGDMAEYSSTSPAPWKDHSANITHVVIGEKVTNVSDESFADCTNLTAINKEVDGVLMSKDGTTTLVCYPADKTEGIYTLPATVTSIADGAFAGNTNLQTLFVMQDTPPTLGGTGVFRDGLTIRVPGSNLATYQSSWSTYSEQIKGLYTITAGDDVNSYASDMVDISYNSTDYYRSGAEIQVWLDEKATAPEGYGGFIGFKVTNAAGEDITSTEGLLTKNDGEVGYTLVTPESDITITALWKTIPVATVTGATGLVYDGNEKALIDAENTSTTGGTLKYSLDKTTWDTEIPTKTAANTYDVYYMVEGNDTYEGIAASETNKVQVTIAPLGVTLTANSRDTDVFDGTEKTVTGFTCSVAGLTFDGVSASGSGTNAGDYDVTFTGVTLNDTKDTSGNYVVTETINGKLTINPAAGLIVSNKVVSAAAEDASRTFEFTVTLSNTTINGSYGEMTFENGVATFSLQDGEQKTAEGLPSGTTFTVTQTSVEGFDTTKEGDTGTISTTASTAAFTNTRETGNLTVSNELVSTVTADADMEFTFTVTLSNTTINGDFGGMTFENGVATITLKGGEQKTAAGIPTDISYTVTQTAAEGFVTTKEGDTGTISTTTSTAAFTNTRIMTYTLDGVEFAGGMHYATYCNTTGKNLTIPEGLKAYAVSGVNGEVVMLAEVEFLPTSSGTTYFPLLLYRAETSTSVGTAYEYTGTATAPTYTHLRYALENVTTTGKEYVLYNDEFVKATGTILAGARYLDLGGTFARRLSIGSEATGIKAIDNGKWTMDNWYDLQGRRIEKPTKPGLYIKNGQKQIVKQNHELH